MHLILSGCRSNGKSRKPFAQGERPHQLILNPLLSLYHRLFRSSMGITGFAKAHGSLVSLRALRRTSGVLRADKPLTMKGDRTKGRKRQVRWFDSQARACKEGDRSCTFPRCPDRQGVYPGIYARIEGTWFSLVNDLQSFVRQVDIGTGEIHFRDVAEKKRHCEYRRYGETRCSGSRNTSPGLLIWSKPR